LSTAANDGLSGGILGGVLYSQWQHSDSQASVYWPSYQIGIGIGFLMVLAGSLVSGITALMKRGKDET
jgi:hypothetical protein